MLVEQTDKLKSLECATGGHGRCFYGACECWCHKQTVEDMITAYERQFAAIVEDIKLLAAALSE